MDIIINGIPYELDTRGKVELGRTSRTVPGGGTAEAIYVPIIRRSGKPDTRTIYSYWSDTVIELDGEMYYLKETDNKEYERFKANLQTVIALLGIEMEEI